MRTLQVRHETIYSYFDEVPFSHNAAHLEPRVHGSQNLLKAEWVIEPSPVDVSRHLDPFGNPIHQFRIDRPHLVLNILLKIQVNTFQRQRPEGEGPSWELAQQTWLSLPHLLPQDTWPYLIPVGRTLPDQAILDYASTCFGPQEKVLKGCFNLMEKIHGDFKFDPEFSRVDLSIGEAFRNKKGVCQDFSHLMLAGLRGLGIPARYVSGYLETLPPPGKAKLVGVDASHAWVEVYVPEVGWVELDPTNNMMAGDRHVVVAVGRDYDDVSPMKGVFHGQSNHRLEVKVDVSEEVIESGST